MEVVTFCLHGWMYVINHSHVTSRRLSCMGKFSVGHDMGTFEADSFSSAKQTAELSLCIRWLSCVKHVSGMVAM